MIFWNKTIQITKKRHPYIKKRGATLIFEQCCAMQLFTMNYSSSHTLG